MIKKYSDYGLTINFKGLCAVSLQYSSVWLAYENYSFTHNLGTEPQAKELYNVISHDFYLYQHEY